MKQFARYIFIQILAYNIDMGAFLLLASSLSFNPLLANAIGKICAGVFALHLHRSFTFQMNRSAEKVAQAGKYFLLLTLNLPLSTFVLSGVNLLGMPIALSKFISDVVCVTITFALSKYFVFGLRYDTALGRKT